MLDINQDIFSKNLLLTQQYCEQQLANTDKNCASILRSINPEKNGQKVFKFSLYEIPAQKPFFAFGTTWQFDPIDIPNLIEDLFEEQIAFKQTQTDKIETLDIYKGDILAFKVDETLVDGAASVSTHGLLDDFNCPPIDTWFYLTKGKSRVLLAWIPIQFVNYIDDGISVNPENCIDWFKIWYPTEIAKVETTNTKTKLSNIISGLPKFFQR